jgi:hypothetical protein
MLALALFAFEAGLANIALSRDAGCQASLASARVAPAAGSGCLSDLAREATNALARGPGSALRPGNMTLISWAVSVVAFALLGGACAQLSPGRGVLVFLGVHVVLTAVVSFVLYIGPHVVR